MGLVFVQIIKITVQFGFGEPATPWHLFYFRVEFGAELAHRSGVIEYRPILGFPDYLVSNEGTVVSMKRGEFKVMLAAPANTGYPRVTLSKKNEPFYFAVHRLVLETFVGPCPEGMEARHINGVRTDCRLSNLAWGTPIENCADKIRHGTQFVIPKFCGTNNYRSKLDDNKVREILTSAESGAALGRKFGVAKETINKVRTGLSWTHVKREQDQN